MKVTLKSNIHLAISVGESVYIALVYLDSKDFHFTLAILLAQHYQAFIMRDTSI